ncbi:MAG: sigma-70 family RNA polymerase sigma factor [Oscillospiraceae bacterium]|nr:sigma-70 family RNA polymerase sigma factor [Oscillospiraceae bacterium]
MLITINLREFYPFYTHDVFVEVTVEVAEELKADKRYHKAHDRRMRRNKGYSFDVEADFEAAALVSNSNNPEAIFFAMMDKKCNLCNALRSLPEIQRCRITAHYLHGKSQTEIAKSEGVILNTVNTSIKRGLSSMKKKMQNNFCDLTDMCPTSDL